MFARRIGLPSGLLPTAFRQHLPPTPESGRLGHTFLRVIFERRPCRYKAGDVLTSVLLQQDTCLSRHNPVCGVRAWETEFAQRCWRGEVSARRLVDSPGDTGGDSVKRGAAEKLNHERPKGMWTRGLASER